MRFFKSLVVMLLMSLVFCFGCTLLCVAETLPHPLNQFKRFAEQRQSELSRLTSFEMTGSITITISDDYLQYSNDRKVSRKSFQIWAKGNQIKEIVKSLDDSGSVVSTTVFYLNPEQVVEVNDSNGSVAKIFSLGKGDNVGLFNFCPSFFEYSFLGLFIKRSGIPALLPSDLVSNEKWTNVVKSLATVELGVDGGMSARISTPEGFSTINLVKSALKSEYQIESISFFTKDKILDRKVKVAGFVQDQVVGDIGKSFKVEVFRMGSQNPSITWDYEIYDVKVNSTIDDEIFVFEPTSVEQIFEGDTKTFIDVPN